MGYNIGGFAIKKNFNAKQNEFLSMLNLSDTDFLKDSTVELAMSMNELENVNILFKEDATIVLNMSTLIGFDELYQKLSQHHEVMTFAISDVSDTYQITKWEFGTPESSFILTQGELLDKSGSYADLSEDDDLTETLLAILEEFTEVQLLGDDFELACKSYKDNISIPQEKTPEGFFSKVTGIFSKK